MSILLCFISPACISWWQLLRNDILLAHCLLMWVREHESGGVIEWEVIAKKKDRKEKGNVMLFPPIWLLFFLPRLLLIAVRGQHGCCCSSSKLCVKPHASSLLPPLPKRDLWSKAIKEKGAKVIWTSNLQRCLLFIVCQTKRFPLKH